MNKTEESLVRLKKEYSTEIRKWGRHYQFYQNKRDFTPKNY